MNDRERDLLIRSMNAMLMAHDSGEFPQGSGMLHELRDTAREIENLFRDETINDLFHEEYCKHGHCALCGNKGYLDTRGKVFTAAGVSCGDLVYCICPNGRRMKELGASIGDV